MKRFFKHITAWLSIAVLLSCVFPFTLASPQIEGYYTYTVSNNTVTITECDNSVSGKLVIPSALGGFPVTVIGKNAFEKCSALKSVIVPDSVKTIEPYAFYDCENLTSITIPGSVTSISKSAFYSCDELMVYGISGSYVQKYSEKYSVLFKSLYKPSLSFTKVTYNGKVRKPGVTVKDRKGNTLKSGKDYAVSYQSGRQKPGAYTVTVIYKGDCPGEQTLSFKILPEGVKSVSTQVNTSAVKLNWNKVTGATGYRVFRYDVSTKTYKKLADVTDTEYKDKNLKSGTEYTYRVQSFTKSNGVVCWSEKYSPSVSAKTKIPPEPTTEASSSSVYVYITDTGTKYHQKGCSYLNSSSHKVTLENAKANGKKPCSRCCK